MCIRDRSNTKVHLKINFRLLCLLLHYFDDFDVIIMNFELFEMKVSSIEAYFFSSNIVLQEILNFFTFTSIEGRRDLGETQGTSSISSCSFLDADSCMETR